MWFIIQTKSKFYNFYNPNFEIKSNSDEEFIVFCGEGSDCRFHFIEGEIESIRLDAHANKELDWHEFMNIVKYGIYPKIQYVQDYIDWA